MLTSSSSFPPARIPISHCASLCGGRGRPAINTLKFYSFLWHAASPLGSAPTRAYQDYYLQRTLRHAFAHSPHYQRLSAERALKADSVRTTGDLHRLGFFTYSSDLRRDPNSFLSVPKECVARTMTTAGTTGYPKSIFFTEKDWKALLYMLAIGMEFTGVTRRDTVQILYCYGDSDWVVAPMLEEAFKLIGVRVVQAGNALAVEEQLDLMRREGPTVLMGTPSYLHRLTAEGLKVMDLRALRIRLMFLGAESWSDCFRRYVEQAWGARAYDSYGMTEMGLVGATECRQQNGLHTSPANVLEVIDPESGENLPPGKEGELVVTTLRREAMPLIRYRTGDIAALLPDIRCPCGIPTSRISRIAGRSDDMVCLGTGENLYPAELERALVGTPEILGYQLVIDKEGYRDTLLLRVETAAPSAGLARAIVEQLYRCLGFLHHDVQQSQTIAEPQVEFVTPGGLRTCSPIKLRHIVDRRRAAVHVEPGVG